MGRLTVDCLGTLRLSAEGRAVGLGSARLRAALVTLALAAGKVVPADRLAAAVWYDELPQRPRASLQTAVSRIRSTIGTDLVRTEANGYRLMVEPAAVDALRFAELVASPGADKARLDQALALWRGTPFSDIGSAWLDEFELPRLVDLYLTTVERRADLAAIDGDAGELLPLLTALSAEHPLREPLWARLLIALDQCGRAADALSRYEVIRARLVDELGVDPSSELQELHARLLRRSGPSLEVAGPADVVPRQLPADLHHLVGRDRELRELDDLMTQTGQVGITGTAGVGKTALALHWAHRVADQFPDGQLYVDLQGFQPAATPLDPSDALHSFLLALQVAPGRIPASPADRAALYRSLVAGKRLLVVLDNCRDSHQVRPLLPGSRDCFVIVTSRTQLPGLVAGGMAPLPLDVLDDNDARQLLIERLGAARVGGNPLAARELAALCSGLPLALSVVAARASTHPSFGLAELAAELRDVRRRLDSLSGVDSVADVRAVLSWSYRILSPEAARMFRLFGIHPGTELGVPAAASMAGTTTRSAHRYLTELGRYHLVVEVRPGRYQAHDLLRAYAAELAADHESAAERDRMLDHYLHTAAIASHRLDRFKSLGLLPEPADGVSPEDLEDAGQALDWHAGEHPTLMALLDLGGDEYIPRLAGVMAVLLSRSGRWHDWLTVEQRAIECAQRLADPAAEARAYNGLAQAYNRLQRYDDACVASERALALFQRLGDPAGQAVAHRTHAYASDLLGRFDDLLAHGRAAVELYRSVGDERGEAHSANVVGWAHARLGEYAEAETYCRQALEILQQLGDVTGEAATWDSLAYAQLHHQRYEVAAASYQRSADIYRTLGDRGLEATALIRLGDTHQAAGADLAARAAWERAVINLEELDHATADTVRAKLLSLQVRNRLPAYSRQMRNGWPAGSA